MNMLRSLLQFNSLSILLPISYDPVMLTKLSSRKFSLVGPLTEVFVAEEILHCTAKK